MSTRSALILTSLIMICCIPGSSQTTTGDQGVAAAPGTAPAAQDPRQPQNQVPPDTSAPPPTPIAKPQSDSISAPTATHSETRYLKGGADIRATLDTPLSTKTARVGDRFTATISAPVRDSIGDVVIPIGSKLNGQISENDNSSVAGAIKDMGHLDLRFTDIQLPSGADVPISATLISVHNSRPTATSRATSSTAIGANAGMAGVFGPPLKGLAVGNLAGGGYVLATTGKQVNLPAECGLRLRIDRTTPLPAQ